MSTDERLCVYLNGRRVGVLFSAKSGMRFRYDDDVCGAYVGSPLLSTSLIVQVDPFDSQTTRNWFSGLLPEGARLDELARHFGIRADSYADILREVGWECAGAVSVIPEGVKPSETTGEPLWINSDMLAKRLASLPSYPYDEGATLRVSLGGFQDKLSVIVPRPFDMKPPCVVFDKVGLSVDGLPTSHILKPQPARFPGMVEGEAWAMTAVSEATPAAHVSLFRLDDAPLTLVVERYDRRLTGEGLTRVHQEDCAQALGIEPERKYATVSSPKKSDPSFAKIASILKAHAEDPYAQMGRLLQQMVANMVMGNTDAHAKNYALLHAGTAVVEMAPLYDVVPAREITPQVVNMGMRIAGQIKIDRVGRSDIVQEARTWGFASGKAERVLDETLEALRVGIDRANERYPEAGVVHAKPALARLTSLLG